MENRPRGREKHVTGKGKDIYKRGYGLHSGPVEVERLSGRGQQSGSGRRPVTRAGGGGLIIIVIIGLSYF
jgi:hypothetical protein